MGRQETLLVAARRFSPGRPAEASVNSEHLSDISAATEQTPGLSFPACELGHQSWGILISLEHGTMVMSGQSFLSSIKNMIRILFLCLCMCIYTPHGLREAVRGHFVVVSCLLPSGGSQGLNSGGHLCLLNHIISS